MKTELLIDITVGDICEGFIYNELEGRGLYGLSGKLVIQPEYQRNYIYADGKKDVAVVQSLLKGYPLGLIYFNKISEDKFEVLDGQQRITSFARFVKGKFAILDDDGMQQYFSGLNESSQKKILETKLTIYVCEGEGDNPEQEIKKWFEIINISGIPLKEQELLNAIYSGPFVTKAKEVFSNSQNSNVQKWRAYIRGDVERQDFLHVALKWVSKDNVSNYMSLHRTDDNITELKTYFETVIEWISGLFEDTDSSMRGLEWGELYEKYHLKPYDSSKLSERVRELQSDYFVKSKSGIYEYVLGGETEVKLLDIRVFDEPIKKAVWKAQTDKAKENNTSNCPLCAIGSNANKTRIWKIGEMDADHVKAWSNGGETSIENCEMLCITHNRAKGNK